MDAEHQQLLRRNRIRSSIVDLARVAILRRIKGIAAVSLAIALCVTCFVQLIPDRYVASSLIQIDPRQNSVPTTDTTDPNFEERTIVDEIDALQSEKILLRVIDQLHLASDPEFARSWLQTVAKKAGISFSLQPDAVASLRANLSVSRVRNTRLLNVRFTAPDAAMAARVANAVADTYLKDKFDGRRAASGDEAVSQSDRAFDAMLVQSGLSLRLPDAQIVAKAEPPEKPSTPKRKELAVLTIAIGTLATMGLALLLELKASGAVRSDSVERTLSCAHLTSIAAVPNEREQTPAQAARRIVVEPLGAYADAVNSTCHELDRRRVGLPSSIVLVVSALPNEGAEHFASNVAHRLAVMGQPALLVDADLRMKGLTRQLAGQCAQGLLDQIAIHEPFDAAILRDGLTGMHFLPASGAAPIPLSVPSVLRSTAFAGNIGVLKERFATIVISAPPLQSHADARALAELADQIVLVTAWNRTPKHLARSALRSLGANQRKVVGAVLTDVIEKNEAAIMNFSDMVAELRRAASSAVLDRAA